MSEHKDEGKTSELKCHNNKYEIKVELTTKKALSKYEFHRMEKLVQLLKPFVFIIYFLSKFPWRLRKSEV